MDMQDYMIHDIRDSAVLTTGYVAGTVLGPTNGSPALKNQLVVLVGFTIGSLTTAEIKVEFSHDGTTYFHQTVSSVGASISTDTPLVHQLGASANLELEIPIKANYIKISVKGTGTVTNSLMSVKAVLGVA